MPRPCLDLLALEPRTLLSAGDADVTFAPRGTRPIGVAGEYSQFVRLANGGHQVTLQQQYREFGGYDDEADGTYIPVTTRDLTYDTFRLRPDGGLDRRYGTRGYVDSPLDNVLAARTLRGGAVLLFGYAGNHYAEAATGTPEIVKLRPSGSLDRSFGERGRVVLRQSIFHNALLRHSVLTPDGALTVLLQDRTPEGGASTPYLRRFDPNDAVHPAFGGKRRIELAARGGTLEGTSLAVGPDDAVYVGGTATTRAGGGLGAMKLVGSAFDTAFGLNGIAASGDHETIGTAIAVDDRGRVSVAGSFAPGYALNSGAISEERQSVVSRFTARGTLDRSFAGGTVIGPRDADAFYAQDASLQAAADGSLVVGFDDLTYRFRTNGTFDDDFGQVEMPGQFFDAIAATGETGGRVISLYDSALYAVQTAADSASVPFLRVAGRTLTLHGDDDADSILLSSSFAPDDTTATHVLYYDATVNGIGRRIAADVIDRAVIDLGGGNDTLDVRSRLPRGVSVSGGDGDDTLDVTADNPTIYGGAGDDVIHSGEGSITVAGRSLIDGGAGNDLIESGTIGRATIYGGNGNDTLTGGQSRDSLYGGAGNDRLNGRAARGLLDGGAGVDAVFSDAFDDGAVDERVSIERG